jgi:hypothetical protein
MRRAGAAALILATSLFVGCDGEPPSADRVRAHLEHDLPGVRFHRGEHVRLGRFTMALVRGLVRVAAADDREARQVLGSIRRVEVATWEIEGSFDFADIRGPGDLERRLARSGWQLMVRETQEDSRTWIFVRPDEGGAIRNLYIVELDPNELTVVDLAGRIDEMMAAAVADDPDGFVADLG